MSSKTKNVILWLVAIILTFGLVIYQRSTGPSYPIRGEVTISGEDIDYKLIRSYGEDGDALVEIFTENADISGTIVYKRFKSYDELSTDAMDRKDGKLIAAIPHQPPAGKVEYTIILHHNSVDYALTEVPVVIRFRGTVPYAILAPHIFFMFFSLLFGFRVGLEIFFRNVDTKYYIGIVLIALFIGGLILGPIVQKFAFGEYWTGWPFGHDLTDNKTLFMFIFWVIAWFVLRKKPENKLWPLIAVFAMLLGYLIPHSVLGSEIDHTKDAKQNTETLKD